MVGGSRLSLLLLLFLLRGFKTVPPPLSPPPYPLSSSSSSIPLRREEIIESALAPIAFSSRARLHLPNLAVSPSIECLLAGESRNSGKAPILPSRCILSTPAVPAMRHIIPSNASPGDAAAAPASLGLVI